MKATGLLTGRLATTEEGLRLLLRLHSRTTALANLKVLGWKGGLDDMRGARQSGQQ
jgi:hypothetical protein